MTTLYNPARQWNAEARIQRMLTDFDQLNSDIITVAEKFDENCGDELGRLQSRKFRLMQDIVATARVLIS